MQFLHYKNVGKNYDTRGKDESKQDENPIIRCTYQGRRRPIWAATEMKGHFNTVLYSMSQNINTMIEYSILYIFT